jgi:hypothetical protein
MGPGAGVRVIADGGAFRLEPLEAPAYELRGH